MHSLESSGSKNQRVPRTHMTDDGHRCIATPQNWETTAKSTGGGMDKQSTTLLQWSVQHMNESNTTRWNHREAFPCYERKKPEAEENALDSCFHLYKF